MGLIVRDCGLLPYAEALALQESTLAAKLAGTPDDYLFLLEHPAVYTLGRGADEADLNEAPQRLGVEVHRVGRGGGVTFHGPGQLVAYPILSLRHAGRDVRRYVHQLEQLLIDVCSDFDIAATRRDDQPGAWVPGAKIASIGIGVRRWITLHGVALNVSTDLSFFDAVVTCRSPEMVMTSMAQCLGGAPQMAAVKRSFQRRFLQRFGYEADEAVTEMHL